MSDDATTMTTRDGDSSRGALDLRSLGVTPGRHCCVVHIDALVLTTDGNALLDALSFATCVVTADRSFLATDRPRETIDRLSCAAPSPAAAAAKGHLPG